MTEEGTWLRSGHPTRWASKPRPERSSFLARTRRNEQTEGLEASRREFYSTQHIIVLLNSSPQADVEAKHINELKEELENNRWRKIYLDAKKCTWPPTQEVSMLQSASNWTLIRSEVLLDKIVHHPGLRGFDLLPGSTCERIFIWKNTGSAMPSAHNSGSQKCFTSVWMLSSHQGPWGRSTQMREGCDHPGHTFHAVPSWMGLEPDWPLHTYMVASPPDTAATGMNSWIHVRKIRFTILFPMLGYCGSHALLTLLK